jgi:transcription initiation factor TFIIB
MHKLSDELNLPRSVLENGSMIYRNALKANYVRGRSILSIVVAALYMACRQCGVLRSLTDFAEAAEVPRKTAAKNYRFLHQKLKLNIPRIQQASYIKRLVSRLRLRGYTEMLAMRLLEEAINNNFTNGRSSAGIAAACIYMSGRIMDEGLTQYGVAHEAQVSEVTIRNRYKELLRNLDIIISV